MSGRDMKTFITQHRSTTLHLHEQKHLVTRAMDGMKSDRYRKADYEKFNEMTQHLRQQTKNKELKLKAFEMKTAKSQQNTMLKHHLLVWTESSQHLPEAVDNIENELTAALYDFQNYSSDPQFLQEFMQFSAGENIDIENFEEVVVDPMRNMKTDLQFRLRETSNYGLTMPKDEIREVLDQISSVQQQSGNVEQYLQYERDKVEKQLSELIQQESEVEFTPADKALPPVLVMAPCPFPDLKSSIINQFIDLHMIYEKKFQEANSSYLAYKDLSTHLLSHKDKEVFQCIREVYLQHTPAHLKAQLSNLRADMLMKFLTDKTRMDAFNIDAADMRRRFSQKRRRSVLTHYERDVVTLHSKSLLLLSESQDEYDKMEHYKEAVGKQTLRCEKLHRELEELRARQAEVIRIEEILAEEEKQREEEERKRKEKINEVKRKKIKSQVSDFQTRKKAQALKVRLEHEERLKILKLEIEEQLKKDKERVKFREGMYQKKLQLAAEKSHKKLDEEYEREKRLNALKKLVAVEVYADPARMVADTIASKAHCGIGANDDDDVTTLFPLYTYTDKEVGRDMRVRVEQALRAAGVHQTEYGRNMIANMKPPTKPRPDNQSVGFRNANFADG